MTAYSFNIFIIFTVYVSFILHPSHGFEVIQPPIQTVNLDGSASISCEHTANVSSVKDVRLSSISMITYKRSMLCQKGMTDCKDIKMLQKNPNKCLFIILNIRPEAMNMLYECEFTVKKDDLDETKKGIPTRLLPGQKEVKKDECTPPLPPPSQRYPLSWILIGLLALIILYSCVITYVYIRLRNNIKDPENCIYVEMRKGPLPANRPFDIYCD